MWGVPDQEDAKLTLKTSRLSPPMIRNLYFFFRATPLSFGESKRGRRGMLI